MTSIGNILPIGPDDVDAFLDETALAEAGGEHAAALRVFRLLGVVATQLRRLTDELMRDAGVTMRQATLITIVKGMGRPTIGEVADVMTTSHQNVKQIALGLERRGLLRIETDERDGRVRRLAVTEENDRFWAARDRDDAAVIATWFAALPPEELVRLGDTLDTIRRAFGTHLEAGRESD